eukprot:4910368-Amphidinium_carterae.1
MKGLALEPQNGTQNTRARAAKLAQDTAKIPAHVASKPGFARISICATCEWREFIHCEPHASGADHWQLDHEAVHRTCNLEHGGGSLSTMHRLGGPWRCALSQSACCRVRCH